MKGAQSYLTQQRRDIKPMQAGVLANNYKYLLIRTPIAYSPPFYQFISSCGIIVMLAVADIQL